MSYLKKKLLKRENYDPYLQPNSEWYWPRLGQPFTALQYLIRTFTSKWEEKVVKGGFKKVRAIDLGPKPIPAPEPRVAGFF